MINIDWDLVKEVTISLPGIILTIFSIYFAHQKVGKKVLVSFSVYSELLTAKRINPIILMNKKNKPVTIFSIQAVINKDIVVEIEKFKPSLILKPLESLHIETTPCSNIGLKDQAWEPTYPAGKVDVYLITNHGKIKCKIISSPEVKKFREFQRYRTAIKSTTRFNGKVYNKKAKYALVYLYQGTQHTAFVMNSGFITGDWAFAYNTISKQCLSNKELLKQHLISQGYDKLFTAISIEEL